MRSRLILIVWLCTSAWPLPVAAQDAAPATRAEAQREARERKQRQLEPNQPDGLQKAMDYAEDRAWHIVLRDGFHPKLGSLTTGSGFAFGVGFRDRAIFARRGQAELWTAASLKRYWAIEGRVAFPDLAAGRVMTEVVAGLREYPRESFFGLGPDSRRTDHSSFLLRTSQVYGRAGVRVKPAFLVGGGLGYLTPRTGSGKTPGLPSIEAQFDAADAPGLGTAADFVRSSGFVEIDYTEPKYARRGGLYRFDVSRFDDQKAGAWSFTRTEVDLRQYIGLFATRRVLALRGLWSSSEPVGGSRGVPFYLMPSLGGNDTLRGFRDYRFRGPHALLLQAEYRWEVWSGLDAAFFYDTGKVGLERRDLNFKGLQSDYGFGFRFNTAESVVLRVDAAFGSRDGKHLNIVFGGVF